MKNLIQNETGGFAVPPDVMVGDSPAMMSLRTAAEAIASRRFQLSDERKFKPADKRADKPVTVLIIGETGTGKETLARHIHACSARADQPFIPVQCAESNQDWFASQFLGQAKQSTSECSRGLLGCVRASSKGMLFLDGIDALTLSMQIQLLRVMRSGRVTPINGGESFAVNLQVIAASSRPLDSLVRTGHFDFDLFNLLKTDTLTTAELAHRRPDILPLARHFLQVQANVFDERVKEISPEVGVLLEAYNWPGNIRELAELMQQAHVLASTGRLEIADIPPRFKKPPKSVRTMTPQLC